jgi:hypothetical protein
LMSKTYINNAYYEINIGTCKKPRKMKLYLIDFK